MSFWTSIFSSKKTVTVASTVYNLAGTEALRPNFLKTTVIGAVLSSADTSLGEQINNTYLNGPGIKLRGFGRWAINYGYSSLIGMGATSVYLVSSVDMATITPLLPTETGATTVVQNARIGAADFVFWVEQYMTIHHPDLLTTAYTCDFNSTTNMVTITLVDTSVETFTISGFNPGAQYLYVGYVYSTPSVPPGGAPTVSAVQYLAYQQNTGNSAFDALFIPSATTSYFLPFIPIRTNKTFISSTYLPTIYSASVTAVKKSMGASFDDIVTKLKTNASIGDIDYAYIVFGVSLNVVENSCRNYIYQFFLDIVTGISTSTTGVTNYSVTMAGSFDGAMDYNMTVSWDSIVETFGTGVLTNTAGTAAKPGDLWFIPMSAESTDDSGFITPAVVRLCWQVDATHNRYMDITNLQHINLIYGGNAVTTAGFDAITATTESGFIIPLNQGIYSAMSLKDSTQMATACCFLVCNSYKVVTAPWYTSGFFKVLLIVAVIAITAVTAGTGIGTSVGLLGTDIAVGSALGLTGTTAVIIGAVTNAIAAMVLVQIVESGSTAIFGKQIGAIVGAIASIVALQVGTSLASGASAADLLNTLTQPLNLLKLTESAGDGYAQFMQLGVQKIEASTQTMENAYSAATNLVKNQEIALMGDNNGVDLTINPLALTDVNLPNVNPNLVLAESPASFFSRTLLSGSDIADLSMSFVTNFCDATLSTDLQLNQT